MAKASEEPVDDIDEKQEQMRARIETEKLERRSKLNAYKVHCVVLLLGFIPYCTKFGF